MSLKDKRILITAGPTWVPIDNVRVISNTATGQTGILLAEAFVKLGAKITLLLGPVSACCLNKRIKLIKYKFFDELKDKLFCELKKSEFDCVIHSAAVSDYRLLNPVQKKISSRKKCLNIRLKPTEKLINGITKISPCSFTIGFKYEPNQNKSSLLIESKKLINHSKVDLVVANTVSRKKYLAYFVDSKGISGPIASKRDLTTELIKVVSKTI